MGQADPQKPEKHSSLSIQQHRKWQEIRYRGLNQSFGNHYRIVIKYGSTAEKKMFTNQNPQLWGTCYLKELTTY